MGTSLKVSKLIRGYLKKELIIEKKIKKFENNIRSKKAIARELCFCIFAANSSALAANRAEKKLFLSKIKLTPKNYKKIAKILRESGVRFHNKKARYCISAVQDLIYKKKFFEYLKIFREPIELRNFLANTTKGLGLKEASHFLRNIGIGKELAILDRHILKSLRKYGVIKKIPKTLTKKTYLKIEQKMLNFCKKIKINPCKLDLYFWSENTGYVFK
ncbi:MAG: N-glycosylase/DNA lyase [Candidatus Anstonellaceae archaeon]